MRDQSKRWTSWIKLCPALLPLLLRDEMADYMILKITIVKKTYSIEELGYQSWFELFEDVRTQNLHYQTLVEFSWATTSEPERDTVTLTLEHIRSMAFLEIYDRLPLMGTAE